MAFFYGELGLGFPGQLACLPEKKRKEKKKKRTKKGKGKKGKRKEQTFHLLRIFHLIPIPPAKGPAVRSIALNTLRLLPLSSAPFFRFPELLGGSFQTERSPAISDRALPLQVIVCVPVSALCVIFYLTGISLCRKAVFSYPGWPTGQS